VIHQNSDIALDGLHQGVKRPDIDIIESLTLWELWEKMQQNKKLEGPGFNSQTATWDL
jgi:hypothetical protein